MARQKLKIAYVIDDLGYGGAQKQLSMILGALNGPVDPHVYVSLNALEIHSLDDRAARSTEQSGQIVPTDPNTVPARVGTGLALGVLFLMLPASLLAVFTDANTYAHEIFEVPGVVRGELSHRRA